MTRQEEYAIKKWLFEDSIRRKELPSFIHAHYDELYADFCNKFEKSIKYTMSKKGCSREEAIESYKRDYTFYKQQDFYA